MFFTDPEKVLKVSEFKVEIFKALKMTVWKNFLYGKILVNFGADLENADVPDPSWIC